MELGRLTHGYAPWVSLGLKASGKRGCNAKPPVIRESRISFFATQHRRAAPTRASGRRRLPIVRSTPSCERTTAAAAPESSSPFPLLHKGRTVQSRTKHFRHDFIHTGQAFHRPTLPESEPTPAAGTVQRQWNNFRRGHWHRPRDHQRQHHARKLLRVTLEALAGVPEAGASRFNPPGSKHRQIYRRPESRPAEGSPPNPPGSPSFSNSRNLAPPAGFEPATFGLEVRCSVH